MFTPKTSPAEAGLEAEIDTLLLAMQTPDKDSKEYAAMTDQLVKLYSLRTDPKFQRVSPDTWAIIAANLGGILLIVGHERANVVTSKALSFLMKLR